MNKIELRAIRTKAKMSQSAFAKALGVSQNGRAARVRPREDGMERISRRSWRSSC